MTAVAAGFFLVREAVGDLELLRRVHDSAEDAETAATLRAIFAAGEMREALWLASPELVDALERVADTPRLADTLYRYLVRACTRCNPFGAFASVMLGDIAPRARFRTGAPVRRVVRLDGGFVEAAARRLSTSTRLRLTSPFYRCDGHYRYVISKPGEERVPRLVLAQVEDDPALRYVADAARDVCESSDLVAALSAFAEVPREEAIAYVDELRESGVLLSDVEPSLTGDIDFSGFERQLLCRGDPAGEMLQKARHMTDEMAAGRVGMAEGAMAIRLLSGLTDHPISEIVQVDSTRHDDSVALPESVISEVGAGALAFLALRPAVTHDPLSDFKRRLAERWGDSGVPLLTALDADFGIPLASFDSTLPGPLTAGLKYKPATEVEWRGTDDDLELVERALAAARRGLDEIVITPDEAARKGMPWPSDAFTALCAIEADDDQALDSGDFRVIFNAVSAASGVRLLGRFCGVVPALQERVRSFLRTFAAPDVIDADIVYSPSGRESNVIRHDRLYDYEIPIGGRGSASAENVIRVEDLLISVHGNELALWDAGRGKRVRPHLSVAHNHGAPTNLAIYRFLCRLEEQNVHAGGPWSWAPLANTPYMPRLRMGRSILARRRWLVDLALQRELARTTDRKRTAELLRRWKDESGCPDEVLAGGLEERVMLDLTAAPALEFFARLIRQGFREAQEALPSPERMAFRAGDRRVVHEIVFPFRRAAIPPSVSNAPRKPSSRPAGRSWSYLKCYGGPALSNDVIGAVAAELRRAVASGSIDRWFFVRYADPEWHVRLRFHSRKGAALAETTRRVERLLRPLLDSGRLWRVQHDTYVSEPTRFGGVEALPHVEQIFWRDSEAAVDALRLTQRDGAPEWLAGIVSIDALVRDFGLGEGERRPFTRARRDAYLAELDDREGVLRHAASVARKYRRQAVAELLAPTPVSSIFAARSAAIARSVARIGALERANRLTVPRLDVLASLAHMTANRIFTVDQRMQEALALDLLTLAYDAVMAKGKERG